MSLFTHLEASFWKFGSPLVETFHLVKFSLVTTNLTTLRGDCGCFIRLPFKAKLYGKVTGLPHMGQTRKCAPKFIIRWAIWWKVSRLTPSRHNNDTRTRRAKQRVASCALRGNGVKSFIAKNKIGKFDQSQEISDLSAISELFLLHFPLDGPKVTSYQSGLLKQTCVGLRNAFERKDSKFSWPPDN